MRACVAVCEAVYGIVAVVVVELADAGESRASRSRSRSCVLVFVLGCVLIDRGGGGGREGGTERTAPGGELSVDTRVLAVVPVAAPFDRAVCVCVLCVAREEGKGLASRLARGVLRASACEAETTVRVRGSFDDCCRLVVVLRF